MGTKFGNLHVQTNQVEAVLQALREIAASRLEGNVREDKEADPSILVELLGHEHMETISKALQEDNREQVVEQFETILEVPLWIHSDWFSDIEDDEIIMQYVRYDMNS